MLVVVASRRDTAARALVARWAAHGAHLLTCEDLSSAGWRIDLDAPERSKIMLGGRAVAVQAIVGVLTRLPWVVADELPRIVASERPYVASEMNAFLLSWLSGLSCPVLNRPTPQCLSGPGWRTTQWTFAAARLGLPVQAVRRRVTPTSARQASGPPRQTSTVIVVGHRCLGATDHTLETRARRLADAAGVDFLAVRFGALRRGSPFISADLWPDVSRGDVADALRCYFYERTSARRWEHGGIQ